MTHPSPDPPPEDPSSIELPKPTAWPIVLAAGVALLAAGLVTSYAFCAVGLLLLVIALAGWIGQLLPGVGIQMEPVEPPERRAALVKPSTKRVLPLGPGMPGHRMHLPEMVHPYSAGLRGGVMGGIVMALVALTYGLLNRRGIWYPINLLAALVLPGFDKPDLQQLEAFSIGGLVAGTLIHASISLMVGLLFGVLLPTLPRSPIFWGGVVGPILWSGAIYSLLGLLNPVMNEEIDWPWFIASQFAFGLTAGIVVVRTKKVPASRFLSPVTESPRDDGQKL